ncbi:MAG: acyl-CoA dehydrogenase family protein [Candidatus Aureabacteria bacterium]|nr:acyl-CoA dehydrogenase family protein [Candidatus Auribacterota bacterium]
MNYFFTEEQLMVRDLARQIAVEKFLPIRAELDEKADFSWDIVKILRESDLFGIYIAKEYGGLGGGVTELCLAVEEMSRVCGGLALSLAATALATFPIILFGSEEQKKSYLPLLGSGKKLAAFALTESAAGSDAGATKTTARKDGDAYLLNGTKCFITNGAVADIFSVVAMTDKSMGSRGASIFIVEKGTKGFSIGKEEHKMGIRTSSTSELIFEDCRIPAKNLLGREGMGFIVAMRTLDQARPGVAAQALGIAQGALDEAVAYARKREQFGRPIVSFQGLQWLLADMATQLEAARALVYCTARAIDAGEKKFTKEAAMSKLFASDVAMYVTTNAVQILGGYGYMKEYPVEKMMRDAKITQIYEGTNQIQRDVIASQLIKESASKKS